MDSGRPAEAATAFRESIKEKDRVLRRIPKWGSRTSPLTEDYLDLARAERASGRPIEAAELLWEHRGLWRDDPKGLMGLARGLANAAPSPRTMQAARPTRHRLPWRGPSAIGPSGSFAGPSPRASMTLAG